MSNKVIFIIGNLAGGGAERVVSNLSLNLPENLEKEIILYGEDSKVDYPYKGKITYLDYDNSDTLLKKIITLIKRIINVNRIKKENPGVPVISFLELSNLINLLTIEPHNAIVSVRNFMSVKYSKGFKAILWGLTFKYLYRKAKKVITVSYAMKEDMMKSYNIPEKKIQVIYNFYDIDKIQEMTNEPLSEFEKKIFDSPVIITVGRLSNQKGQEHLIKSFYKVKKKVPKSQLVILGEGKLEKKLKNLANNLGLQDSVHFLGFKNNPFKYIARSNVFVLTSYFEGFPNALAEAMACKVPVISTDCKSGPREILAPNSENNNIQYGINRELHGILIPDPSTTEVNIVENYLTNSILNILNNDELSQYFSLRAYKRIKNFSVKNIIKDWEKIIHDEN